MSRKTTWLLAWLGRRFGAPSKHRTREFDQRLSDAIVEFNDVLRVGYETRPEGASQERLRQRAESAAGAFDALTPRDGEWAQVVGDYRELAAIHLRYFGEVLPESTQQEFAAINRRADARRQELRQVDRTAEPSDDMWS